mmetsp:Transcript_60614/g.179723  ORF Transcript_60614/g.179723 Transcript_60614/m.179723 type:complete len:233 (-) Transcript_60614:710-1408(-)
MSPLMVSIPLLASFRSLTNFSVLGASSFISFCNCRNAAFNTILSSSKTATRSFNSSTRESRDCTTSDRAELFCCNTDNDSSSSSTLDRSRRRASMRVERARSLNLSSSSSLSLSPHPNIHAKKPFFFLFFFRLSMYSALSRSTLSVSIEHARPSNWAIFFLSVLLNSSISSRSAPLVSSISDRARSASSNFAASASTSPASAVQFPSLSRARLDCDAARASASDTRSVRAST